MRRCAAWIADRELWLLAPAVAMATFVTRLAIWGLGLIAVLWLVRWIGRGHPSVRTCIDLPAMLLLEQYPEDNPVKELFHNPNMPEKDKRDKIRRAIGMVGNSSIVKQCYELASDYCEKACRDLGKLPAKPSRQALRDLADLVINRKK